MLPANDPDDPTSAQRSPYSVSLTAFVSRFGVTESRRRLLTGLLDFRSALHSAGLVSGFQWVNGSFLENVEEIRLRDPRDIDLVTFFHLPIGLTNEATFQSNPNLFINREIKERYNVDAYFAYINPEAPEDIVKQTVYWYSLWSHNRDGSWKGFVQIDLANAEDEHARSALQALHDPGVNREPEGLSVPTVGTG